MSAERGLVREYHDDDLETVIRLIDATSGAQESVFSLAECIGALRARQPAVVATHHGRAVGAALSLVRDDRAWIARIAILDDWRGRGLTSTLLLRLEAQLVERHVSRISYVLREEELLASGLENAGYSRRPATAYFDKKISLDAEQAVVLDRLGGQLLPAGMWDDLAGMMWEKSLIERRVILPLAEPELANRHGVVAPRAVILFGPPGTGKTTFARSIASRLGWPFVELFPSRLSNDRAGLARGLRDAFAEVAHLDEVVVFIDEVEEIASTRQPDSKTQAVTNELLKLLPVFRQHDTRLLICATNTLRDLDSAFLRPGRFDYILPIGTPDDEARHAIWTKYVFGAADVSKLIEPSEGMTPAEIEFVARAASQASFERSLDGISGTREPAGPVLEDFLSVMSRFRRSITDEVRNDFDHDTELLARS